MPMAVLEGLWKAYNFQVQAAQTLNSWKGSCMALQLSSLPACECHWHSIGMCGAACKSSHVDHQVCVSMSANASLDGWRLAHKPMWPQQVPALRPFRL